MSEERIGRKAAEQIEAMAAEKSDQPTVEELIAEAVEKTREIRAAERAGDLIPQGLMEFRLD